MEINSANDNTTFQIACFIFIHFINILPKDFKKQGLPLQGQSFYNDNLMQVSYKFLPAY